MPVDLGCCLRLRVTIEELSAGHLKDIHCAGARSETQSLRLLSCDETTDELFAILVHLGPEFGIEFAEFS